MRAETEVPNGQSGALRPSRPRRRAAWVLALALGLALAGSSCDRVRAWVDPDVLYVDYHVFDVAVSPDGRYAAAGGIMSGWVTVYDLTTGQVAAKLDTAGPAYALAFSPDGRYLAAGVEVHRSKDGVELYDTRTWSRLRHLVRPEVAARNAGGYSAVAFSPDGRYLAGANGSSPKGGGVDVWDVATGLVYRTLPCAVGELLAIAYSPDGRTIAAGGIRDDVVELWDVASGQLVRKLGKGAKGDVEALAFTPDGTRLLCAFMVQGTEAVGAGDVKLWDVASGALVASVSWDPKHWIRSAAVRPGGKEIIVCGGGETIVRFGASDLKWLSPLGQHPAQPVHSLAFDKAGKVMVSGGQRFLKVWRFED
ncbi:MAG: WD40 repeat domain-containing protein [Deferrisomatales bacterium]